MDLLCTFFNCLMVFSLYSFDRTFNLSYSLRGIEISVFLKEGPFIAFNLGWIICGFGDKMSLFHWVVSQVLTRYCSHGRWISGFLCPFPPSSVMGVPAAAGRWASCPAADGEWLPSLSWGHLGTGGFSQDSPWVPSRGDADQAMPCVCLPRPLLALGGRNTPTADCRVLVVVVRGLGRSFPEWASPEWADTCLWQ